MVDRRERIILDLDDRFSPKIARSSVAARAFANELDRAGSSSEDLDGNLGGLASSSDRVTTSTRNADRSINQLTGRLRVLRDTAALVGPALIPIGAVGTVGLGGVAMTAGLATTGLLALVAASQGVGDALKAVNDATLDPTVENVAKAEEAMSRLAPQAQRFVSEFQDLRPVLDAIGEAGAQDFFPGLTESLSAVEAAAPQLERLMSAVGEAGGEGIGGLIEGAAGDEEFLNFLTAEVPQAMTSLIDLTGTLSHGMSRLFMALEPGNDSLLDWANGVADAFDRWASSPQGREDVRAFLDYAEQNGPAVADFFGSLASAITQVVQAAAPLGGPTLEVLSTVLDVIGGIADSDLGTPIMLGVGALAAYNRTLAVTAALQKQAGTGAILGGIGTYATNLKTSAPTLKQWGTAALYAAHSNDTLAKSASSSSTHVAGSAKSAIAARSAVSGWAREAGRAAGPIAGLAVLSSGAADGMGLTNSASLALMGTIAGPWGAAIGGAAGLLLDMKAATNATSDAVKDLNAAADAGDIAGMGDKITGLLEGAFDASNITGVGDFFGDFVAGLGEGLEGDLNQAQDALDEWTPKLENLTGVLGPLAAANNEVIRSFAFGDKNYTFGNLEDLQRVATSVQPALDNLGITLDDLLAADSGSEQAALIADIATEMDRLDSRSARVTGVADAFAGLDSQLMSTAASASQVATALNTLLDPQLNAEEAANAWGESLRTLGDDLANAKAGLNGNTAAIDANENAVIGRVRALKDMIAAQAENGASGRQLSRTLQQGRDDLIAAGRAAGLSGQDMRKYLRTLGLTPKLVRTTIRAVGAERTAGEVRRLRSAYNQIPLRLYSRIQAQGIPQTRREAIRLADDLNLTAKERRALITLQSDAARNGIKTLDGFLDSLNKKRTNPRVTVDNSAALSSANAVESRLNAIQDETVFINVYERRHGGGRADGGTVWNGTAGGTVPGTRLPYGDRVPTLLTAGGEEVISNRYGQADRHRALLKAINANRAADGATIARQYARGFDGSRGGGGTQTVIHRVEVVGELDAKRAVAAIHQRIDQRSQDVYDANRDFEEGHGLG